ncbi:hypothetical protein ASG67_17370 [Sphingomonas sp. Leaf339]|uniref:hypothetical protein n=1 Tax=Sphingomonas sp. Leaf339 TaxID=1736343 RepID=UPI0006F70E4F|nr:hypothetical protein [Sphingomonas sp. Leaf339]KQU57218.1 hypothetical protein ASG67_17370 [Sphingomonas sp. Leaf339]
MTIILFALALIDAPAARQTPSATPEPPVVATSELVLDWPADAALSMETDGAETIVRFGRGPDAAALDAFRQRAGADLGRMEWNDTSMVIRPAPNRRFVSTVAGDRLTIRVIRDAPIAMTVPAEPLDYALAQAAADAAAGYPGRSRRRLMTLDRQAPGDPQVARALADADTARGATARAAVRYRTLGATDTVARRTIRAAAGEMATVATVRDGRGFTQAEASLRVAVPVLLSPTGTDVVIGGAVRRFQTSADAVVTSAGTIRSLRRGTLFADVTGSIGNAATRLELQGAVNLTDTRAGLGGRLVVGPAEREGRVIGGWHLPDVSTAEQALLGGYIDRWGAGGTLRLSPALSVQGDAVRTFYGLGREGTLARTTVVTGGFDATVRRMKPAMTLLYRLEAEYVDRLVRRPGGALSLPLVDRENHTVQALIAEQLGAWRIAGAAGWTFDRFGGNGPTATLTVAGYLDDAWQIEAAGGVSSVQRPNLVGTQVFARAGIKYSMGPLP